MLNDDYIKRSEAVARLTGKAACVNSPGKVRAFATAINVIETMPAADVEPVIHGWWVKSTGMMPPEFAGNYHCSECGWHGISVKEREYKRCPECGARMDAEPPKGEDDD